MIGERVLEFEDLQRLSGQTQLAAVERWAKANGIAVGHGRKGLWTTLGALEKALGIAPANDPGPIPATFDLTLIP